MPTNADTNWLEKIVVGSMFTALLLLGLALWNVSAKADDNQRADIKIIETRIEDKLETKDSHDKDIAHIRETFTFITQQLAEIKEAVKP